MAPVKAAPNRLRSRRESQEHTVNCSGQIDAPAVQLQVIVNVNLNSNVSATDGHESA
jgi:hypothetical protein